MRALIVVVAAIFAADSPSDLVARVQTAYQSAGDMHARFTQTYVDKLRGKKKVESGELWATRDGRVRWTYAAPERKDFIFDGKAAYFYEPDNAQVTVFDRFADSPVAHAMEFLWGRGDLRQSFSMQPCSADCPPLTAGEQALTLVPKEPIAAVDHVLLVIDAKALRVRRSLVFDPLGNRSEYAFTDVTFGAPVDAAKFAFVVPPGVSLLKATNEGVAAPAPPAATPSHGGAPPHGLPPKMP